MNSAEAVDLAKAIAAELIPNAADRPLAEQVRRLTGQRVGSSPSHGRLHSARAIAAWLAQIGAQIGKIVLLYASKAASALVETGSQQRTQKYTGLFNALELLRSTMLADTAHTAAAQFMCALC
jgi:hypothetical protein